MNDKTQFPPLRRIVTGHDSRNVAKAIMDGALDFNAELLGGDQFKAFFRFQCWNPSCSS